MSDINSILLVAFPNIGEQDLLAPWELLKSLAWALSEQGRTLEVTLGALQDATTISTHTGLTIQGVRIVSPKDRFDVVYVPGGIGAGEQASNEELLQFLRDHHAEQRWVAANCAGVGVLHRAGILTGVDVTAPATLARRLPAQGSRVVTPRRAWKVDPEHRIFTAGGAATVHASTIALVSHLFGEAHARELAANWDTLPLHGESLFSLVGPAMADEEQTVRAVQDRWENVFLPAA
jgi:transcriptional regulator GlxA family with amidase domain